MEIVNDCHVHLASSVPTEVRTKPVGKAAYKKRLLEETPSKMLKGMDKNGVDKVILLSGTDIDKIDIVRIETNRCAKIVKAGKNRFYGFLRINPVMPGAADEIKRAINDLGYTGVKMLPNYWYPYEDRVQKIYKVINELQVPILFHSGILWGHGASSMYCRPAYYECMMNYPKVKFALAHIGWPRTDECLAVAGRFSRGAGGIVSKTQMYIDITTGAPRIWKTDVMKKTLSYIPHSQIVYGSDDTPWREGYRDWVKTDFEILADIGATKETVKKIMNENFYSFVK